MLNVLETEGEISSKDRAVLEAMSKEGLIETITHLMKDFYEKLCALEYLHGRDLEDLESSFSKRLSEQESLLLKKLAISEVDLNKLRSTLRRFDRKLNIYTN